MAGMANSIFCELKNSFIRSPVLKVELLIIHARILFCEMKERKCLTSGAGELLILKTPSKSIRNGKEGIMVELTGTLLKDNSLSRECSCKTVYDFTRTSCGNFTFASSNNPNIAPVKNKSPITVL